MLSQLTTEARAQAQGLYRMSQRWELRHAMPREEWESDTRLYVAHHSGYQAIAWFGLFAPAGTSADIVAKLDKEAIRIFNDPAFRARFLDPQMFESMAGPPEEFAAFIRAERDKWAKVIHEAGIKVE